MTLESESAIREWQCQRTGWKLEESSSTGKTVKGWRVT